MLENYLSAWLGTLRLHRTSAVIGVMSLTLGLACAIFVIIFIRDELSYDRWISGSENIYRVEVTVRPPGSAPIVTPSAPFALAEAMRSDIPEVKDATPIVPGRFTIVVADRKFLETINFVDRTFLEMFQLPLVEGDAHQALLKPESAVISESMAHKLFGSGSPVNQTLVLDGKHTLLITAVMRDLPYNTQLTDHIFASSESLALPVTDAARDDWMAFVKYVFVRLTPGADANQVRGKVLDLFDRHLNSAMLFSMGLQANELIGVRLNRLHDTHLSSDQYVNGGSGRTWSMLYGFAAIAVVVLGIACSNFATLATAQATTRAREVSMRKVLGASSSALTIQFLLEALLLASLAFVAALGLVTLLLPFYASIVGHETDLLSWQLTMVLAAVVVTTGLVAGMYPALMLSRLSPSISLKTGNSPVVGNRGIRNALVVAQFGISIGLAITTLVMFSQVRHVETIDLGFRHDNVVVVDASIDPTISDSTQDTLVKMLQKHPSIESASRSATIPFEANDARGSVWIEESPNQYFARHLRINADYPELYRMRLLAGRMLSPDFGQDVSSPQVNSAADDARNVMINASLARMFGFSPTEAIGKQIFVGNQARVNVVGVLEDALLQGPREGAIPTLFFGNTVALPKISVRIKDGQITSGLSAIDAAWRQLLPNVAISRHFLTEDFRRSFEEYQRRGMMFAVFASLTIAVACLGLFGLAAFSVQRDAKAIGMRRVLGASTAVIIRWQLYRFSALILVAFIVACPIAIYGLQRWLEGFQHRIELSWPIFVSVGIAMLGIAWSTVLSHVIYAARLNPIDTLRYE